MKRAITLLVDPFIGSMTSVPAPRDLEVLAVTRSEVGSVFLWGLTSSAEPYEPLDVCLLMDEEEMPPGDWRFVELIPESQDYFAAMVFVRR